MHFSLVDLRLMVRIADTSSITRAAEASHLSLSAVSTRIKGLEESVGAGLLHRTSQGVTTSTTAISASARRVRLSIQMEKVAREPGRSRRGEMGGNGRYDAWQANYHEAHHDAEAPRRHMRSSLDNNGKRPGEAATA